MARFENKGNLMIVRSSKASLLKAFIEECENIGWKYVDNFTNRSCVANYTTQVGKDKCLYFSTDFTGAFRLPGFSLSSATTDSGEEFYNLDTEFILALDAAKVAYDVCKKKEILVKNISKDYDATVIEKGIVVVWLFVFVWLWYLLWYGFVWYGIMVFVSMVFVSMVMVLCHNTDKY